jgi:hypothetical protein
MINYPKTREEAEKRTYGFGTHYRPDYCVQHVHDDFGVGFHQCCRKPGHGPGELYCRQHAKMIAGED